MTDDEDPLHDVNRWVKWASGKLIGAALVFLLLLYLADVATDYNARQATAASTRH